MNDQKRNEVIKALAYGRTPEDIANAEDVIITDVSAVKKDYGNEIAERRSAYIEGGFINESD